MKQPYVNPTLFFARFARHSSQNGGQERWTVGGKKVVEINMGRKDSVQNLRDSGMMVRGKSWDEKVWNGGLEGVTT